MPGMKKLFHGVLLLLLMTGCGPTAKNSSPVTRLDVDPRNRIFTVLPVADYSYVEDVEAAHRQQALVHYLLTAGLATRGFPLSSQQSVFQVLTESGIIKAMSYEKDIKVAEEMTSLENMLNEDWSDMMKSEIVKMTKTEARRRIPGIARQDNHLPAPATALLDRNAVLHLGRELGAEYILRGRLLVYDLRQEYSTEPLRRQILPFFQGGNGLQHFATAKAAHYDPVDNLIVGGALTNLGKRNDYGFRLQLWAHDAITGDVIWTGRAINPIEEDNFMAAAATAANGLIASLVATIAVDSDGDGVWDHRDRCPATPRGVQVGVFGCPRAEIDPADDAPEVIHESLALADVDWPEFLAADEVLSIDLRIEFDFDKAEIKPSYRAEMEKVASFLKTYPETRAVIEGHTDEEGTDEYNMKLSQQRADAVKKSLVKRFGIDASRLKAVGFGKSRPLADNKTPAGRQQNRRAVAVISTTVEK
jgi:outer membrane protein OmpA-like peptidoglycan-associated protein